MSVLTTEAPKVCVVCGCDISGEKERGISKDTRVLSCGEVCCYALDMFKEIGDILEHIQCITVVNDRMWETEIDIISSEVEESLDYM